MEKNIYQQALNKFGKQHQKNKAIEELSELIRALCRKDYDNIIEEIADVQIMLDQLLIIYPASEIAAMKLKKLEVLAGYLKA